MQIPSSHLSLQKENTAIKKEKKKNLSATCTSFSSLGHTGKLYRYKKKKKMNLNCFTK